MTGGRKGGCIVRNPSLGLQKLIFELVNSFHKRCTECIALVQKIKQAKAQGKAEISIT